MTIKFPRHLSPFKDSGKKWGYKDKRGNIAIPPQFDRAEEFIKGLALVAVTTTEEGPDGSKPVHRINYGYVDELGKFAIYDGKNCFDGKPAWIYYNDLFYHVDERGDLYSPNEKYSEGLIRKRVNGKYGFYDYTDRCVITPRFDLAGDFSEGLVAVGMGFGKAGVYGKWGYADRNGKIVMGPRYESAKEFSEGLAAVRLNKKWGYIDRSGKIAIQPRYEVADIFSEGLANVLLEGQKLMCYINTRGDIVIPNVKYSAWERSRFSGGMAIICSGDTVTGPGKYGIIDKTGKIVIPLIYDDAKPYKEGVAFINKNGVWLEINKTGNKVRQVK